MKSSVFLLLTLNIATNRRVCQTSPAAHHICDGTKTEQAGLSGSIEFKIKCDLTLTNFTQPVENETHRYSIPGISAQGRCSQTGALSTTKVRTTVCYRILKITILSSMVLKDFWNNFAILCWSKTWWIPLYSFWAKRTDTVHRTMSFCINFSNWILFILV